MRLEVRTDDDGRSTNKVSVVLCALCAAVVTVDHGT
jgi:hypothetical protein